MALFGEVGVSGNIRPYDSHAIKQGNPLSHCMSSVLYHRACSLYANIGNVPYMEHAW